MIVKTYLAIKYPKHKLECRSKPYGSLDIKHPTIYTYNIKDDIKNKQGNIITDDKGIQTRWKEHFDEVQRHPTQSSGN